jgi:hypothetical protein
MNQVPHITIEQAKHAFTGAVVPLELLKIYNERIDKANSEQEQYITAEKYITHDEAGRMGTGSSEFYDPRNSLWSLYPPIGLEKFKCRAVKKNIDEQPLISAEEARKLGVGNVEYFAPDADPATWQSCHGAVIIDCFRGTNEPIKYRAIKQPKPVEPHAELKANLVKLDGELMTREAAATSWKSKIDTHVMWFKFGNLDWTDVIGLPKDYNEYFMGSIDCEYQLRARPLKQVSLDPAIREDVISLLKELGFLHEGDLV